MSVVFSITWWALLALQLLLLLLLLEVREEEEEEERHLRKQGRVLRLSFFTLVATVEELQWELQQEEEEQEG